MKRTLKKIYAMLVIITLLTGTSGCATTDLIEKIKDPRAENIIEFPEINDTIVAIGQPDKVFLEQLGHPKTIAFLGLKHTYFLLEGGEALVQISKVLNGNFIHIAPEAMRMTEDHVIVGYSHDHRMFVKDNKIWGSITINYYHDDGTKLSKEEIYLLDKMYFIKTKTTDNIEKYTKNIDFKGIIGPKVDIPESQIQSFKLKRSISFFAPSSSTVVPTIGRYLAIPLAIVIDAVITPPLVIIGIPVFLLTFKGIH